MNLEFYKDKTVLITGHNGFKGSWMSKVLVMHGANVIGYSLPIEKDEISLFEMLELENQMTSITGDIRDLDNLVEVFEKYQPEIVIHMAAQPLVRESYMNPAYTYDTNVMGTVNILEAVRLSSCVKSFINVTTDKVYKNNEWEWGYRENDILDGYDPYSNSKSCSELVTNSYFKSFFLERNIAITTCRAGNVIGGGDFSKDRIIPDCVKAQQDNKQILVRNPYSTRPYQHVLEPVCAYLYIAMLQYENAKLYQGNYNVGPDDCDCVTTGELVNLFCLSWEGGAEWKDVSESNAPHEAGFLKLDCTRIKKVFNWKPKWHIDEAIKNTVLWSKVYLLDGNVREETERQIKEYLG